MHKALAIISRLALPTLLIGILSNAHAAPQPAAEDRYIAARDAAIEKFSKIQDAATSDDATRKAEDAVRADLLAQMKTIVVEPDRKGFGPAKLNLDTFYRGDEGFGALDGLHFDAELGDNGEKAGENGADGSRGPISSSRRRRCSSAGCASTRNGGTRASRTCRSRSARR
jgi:hypothetical protein